jgi:hypothetical protein
MSINRTHKLMACFALIMAPSLAQAASFTPVSIIFDAAPPVQFLILGLLLSLLAAVFICLKKLMQGPRISGGSAFLKGLRLGGPLAGFVGATFTGLNMAIGLSNAKEMPPIQVLAPGYAEIAFLVLLGLLVGSVAVITNWAVEARLDRTVLGE